MYAMWAAIVIVLLVLACAGSMERNLIPCDAIDMQERIQEKYLAEPLSATASAVAVPHPEKIQEGGKKAVNRKEHGWGGEDAYFYCKGRSAATIPKP